MSAESEENKRRFLKQLFPRMSMCTWRIYGTGGDITKENYLCMLNNNVIIEKIFVFLWFWLVFLLLSSILNFAYHVLFMVSKNEVIRSHVLAFTTNTTIKNLQIRVDDGNREKEKQQQRNVNQVYQIIYTLHRKGKISFSSFYIHWLRQNISFSTQLHPMLICQLSDIC